MKRKAIYSKEYGQFLRRLRWARLQAGFVQTYVAKRLKRPPSFVSKCESGERRVDVIDLARFAELYKRPFAYFVPATTAPVSKRKSRKPGALAKFLRPPLDQWASLDRALPEEVQGQLEALLLELEQWERTRDAPAGSEALDFRRLRQR